MLVAASALAVVVVRLPARYQRLRASARSGGYGVREWLAHQQGRRLARRLTGLNCPIMIGAAGLGAHVGTATPFHYPPAGGPRLAAGGEAITAGMMTEAD